MNLTDDQKKRLTEFLGEYYCHPDNCNNNCERYKTTTSPLCIDPISFRTFTTPQDMMDLKDRLVEKGMWEQFEQFSFWKWVGDKTLKEITFTRHIINPATFIPLVSSFLEAQDA